MKLDKTQKDIDKMVADEERLPILKVLRELQHYKFNVGDVLVKLTPESYNDDAKWIPELDSIGAPQRYMYVFENDFGIGYVKKLNNASNSLGVGQCLASFKPDKVRFKIDPDYVDHLIIGEGSFDHKERHKNLKKFRNDANKENLKIAMPATNPEERVKLWDQLQVGTIFYVGASGRGTGGVIEFHICYKVITCPANKAQITLEVMDSAHNYNIGEKLSYTKADFLNRYFFNSTSSYSFIRPLPLKEGEKW